MWWAIVETRPGPGFPRDWEKRTARGELPHPDDYGEAPVLDCSQLQDNFGGRTPKLLPHPVPEFGPNWYEDVGAGKTPSDAWFFYMHISCMHCTDPACVRACPSGAIYKREDGIVLIDQNLCKGFKACILACPYKRIFWNEALRFSEKCILCYPRLEEGKPPMCVLACAGKAIFFGDLNNPQSKVSKLVRQYKVALPLHPEYNTQPNIFYIPPVFTPVKGGTDQKPTDELRIPRAELRRLFGPEVDRAMTVLVEARNAAARGQVSELIEILTSYPTYEL
ncbi:4Fe-4S dicluster domain-containing protein [Ammonifex degensii]|nr:4Fe-4S dicluster domain-containing protein [Ammonifex degensii]